MAEGRQRGMRELRLWLLPHKKKAPPKETSMGIQYLMPSTSLMVRCIVWNTLT
jgi:hypothetical protein